MDPRIEKLRELTKEWTLTLSRIKTNKDSAQKQEELIALRAAIDAQMIDYKNMGAQGTAPKSDDGRTLKSLINISTSLKGSIDRLEAELKETLQMPNELESVNSFEQKTPVTAVNSEDIGLNEDDNDTVMSALSSDTEDAEEIDPLFMAKQFLALRNAIPPVHINTNPDDAEAIKTAEILFQDWDDVYEEMMLTGKPTEDHLQKMVASRVAFEQARAKSESAGSKSTIWESVSKIAEQVIDAVKWFVNRVVYGKEKIHPAPEAGASAASTGVAGVFSRLVAALPSMPDSSKFPRGTYEPEKEKIVIDGAISTAKKEVNSLAEISDSLKVNLTDGLTKFGDSLVSFFKYKKPAVVLDGELNQMHAETHSSDDVVNPLHSRKKLKEGKPVVDLLNKENERSHSPLITDHMLKKNMLEELSNIPTKNRESLLTESEKASQAIFAMDRMVKSIEKVINLDPALIPELREAHKENQEKSAERAAIKHQQELKEKQATILFERASSFEHLPFANTAPDLSSKPIAPSSGTKYTKHALNKEDEEWLKAQAAFSKEDAEWVRSKMRQAKEAVTTIKASDDDSKSPANEKKSPQ